MTNETKVIQLNTIKYFLQANFFNKNCKIFNWQQIIIY